ncbi:MAG: hypothetical protein MUO51_08325, partial [Woeseiaceae bacterium]|nr:hypothetical protein [Woeseiaceae bacterium]
RISDSQLFAAFGEQRLSHDNISHTLLGMYDVSASSYLRESDIFSASEGPDTGRRVVSATSNK